MELFFQFVVAKWYLFGALLFVAALLFKHESRRSGPSVTPNQLSTMVNQRDAVVLDIRDHNDFKTGHIPGSLNIPTAKLEERMAELEKSRDKPVIVVCKMGQTATGVSKRLKESGFSEVYRLGGGLLEWQGSNLPVVRS